MNLFLEVFLAVAESQDLIQEKRKTKLMIMLRYQLYVHEVARQENEELRAPVQGLLYWIDASFH